MEALFIIINDLDYLDDVLEALIDLKVKGATILDSEGLAQAIIKAGLNDVYKIGPFARDLEDNHQHNKTIFSVMKKEKIILVVKKVKEILRQSSSHGVGFMFSIPISRIYLVHEEHHE